MRTNQVFIYLYMKVHLIRKETIEGYAIANARSRSSFEDWLGKIKHADWKKPMWIGTHTEYDELCGKEEQYTVSTY